MNILYLATLCLLLVQTNQLALILIRMEDYCFEAYADKPKDIKFNYVISGLNEDQVEFKVHSRFH